MGQRAAQAYGLTGEVFDGNVALRLGLIHQLVSPEELGKVVLQYTERLLSNGSSAMATMKRELVGVQHLPEPLQQESTSRIIARLRVSTEGQEGVSAFLEKRKPPWNIS
jgi:methylglutaconyl-CoA hydratase